MLCWTTAFGTIFAPHGPTKVVLITYTSMGKSNKMVPDWQVGQKYMVSNFHFQTLPIRFDKNNRSIGEFWDNWRFLRKYQPVGVSLILGRGKLVIGQEQDVLGGRFSQSESFLGKISYLEIWKSVLDPDSVWSLMNSCEEGIFGDLYAWAEFKSHIHGDVEVSTPYLFSYSSLSSHAPFRLKSPHSAANARNPNLSTMEW